MPNKYIYRERKRTMASICGVKFCLVSTSWCTDTRTHMDMSVHMFTCIHSCLQWHECKHSPESHEEAIWKSWSINHRRSTVVRNIQSSIRDNGPHHKTQPLNCQRGQLYRPPPRGRLLRDCVLLLACLLCFIRSGSDLAKQCTLEYNWNDHWRTCF